MKKLIIAEKPSVGKGIAKALGCTENGDGYMEGHDYVISWCVGHLIANVNPEEYDPELKKWNVETLPIIPEKWKFKVVPSTAQQYNILRMLMERDDISSLVEATDAGREGELIFRLVYNFAHCKKPFERLWISSLEERAIKEGMANLKPSCEYDNLYRAAMYRSSADWLYGINGTRLYTLTTDISEKVVSVGRVQTPTLKMIVDRQKEIDNFKVTPRWVVQKNFGTWALETDFFTDKVKANECLASTREQDSTITKLETQKKKQSPPLLFSLTTLSQEANKRLGLTAQETLDIMQKLYEMKILTYPRTDSNYITSDMDQTFLKTVKNIAALMYHDIGRYDVKRNINNDKVSDHHAVILTESFAAHCNTDKLSSKEVNLVYIVAARMIAACSAWMEWEETKVEADCKGYVFTGSGRKILVEGWREVMTEMLKSKIASTNEFPSDIAKGKSYKEKEISIQTRDTKPPYPYTEDTLLGAMDKAGAKEMDNEVERKGLGTSATRASIIEILIKRGYVTRKKKYLVPTIIGIKLIDTVPDKIKNVDTTVEWENKLLDIEKGRSEDANKFLELIKGEVRELCKGAVAVNRVSRGPIAVGKCPFCGEDVMFKGKMATCKGCETKLWTMPKILGGHELDEAKIKKLFAGERILESIYSKTKAKWYRAHVSIDTDKVNKGEFYDLKIEFDVMPAGGTGGKKWAKGGKTYPSQRQKK